MRFGVENIFCPGILHQVILLLEGDFFIDFQNAPFVNLFFLGLFTFLLKDFRLFQLKNIFHCLHLCSFFLNYDLQLPIIFINYLFQLFNYFLNHFQV